MPSNVVYIEEKSMTNTLQNSTFSPFSKYLCDTDMECSKEITLFMFLNLHIIRTIYYRCKFCVLLDLSQSYILLLGVWIKKYKYLSYTPTY